LQPRTDPSKIDLYFDTNLPLIMSFEYWKTNWEKLGADDPLWAILTDPEKKGGEMEPRSFFCDRPDGNPGLDEGVDVPKCST